MSVRRKMAMKGVPPHLEGLVAEGTPKRGKFIMCAECKQGGGTLVKQGDDRYVHQICPSPPAVLHPSTGLVLPPPKLWLAKRRIK